MMADYLPIYRLPPAHDHFPRLLRYYYRRFLHLMSPVSQLNCFSHPHHLSLFQVVSGRYHLNFNLSLVSQNLTTFPFSCPVFCLCIAFQSVFKRLDGLFGCFLQQHL